MGLSLLSSAKAVDTEETQGSARGRRRILPLFGLLHILCPRSRHTLWYGNVMKRRKADAAVKVVQVEL